MATLQRFADAAGMTREEIWSVPSTQLAAAAVELGFSALDTAKLIAEIERERPRPAVTKDSTQLLVDQQERIDSRLRDPWRSMCEHMEKEREAVLAAPTLQLPDTFLSLAKGKALLPDETMVCGYVLYGKPAALRYFAHLMLHKQGAERIRSHNFHAASLLEDSESFLLTYGAALLTLPVPLLPPAPPFAPLNIQLMREYHVWLEQHQNHPRGGGAQRTFVPSIYAATSRSDGPEGRRSGDPAGGGSLPVISDGNGGWGVDVTQLEQAFDTVWHQLAAVTEAVKKLHEAKSTGEIKTLADAITARLEETKQGFGRARGATFRGRGTGRGGSRGRGAGRNF